MQVGQARPGHVDEIQGSVLAPSWLLGEPVDAPGRSDDHLRETELRNPDGTTVDTNVFMDADDVNMDTPTDMPINYLGYEEIFQPLAIE